MSIPNHPASPPDIPSLRARALNLRRKMMAMASGKGEGYIAQGLGIADCLAAIYFHELRYDSANPNWAQRDRFVLSTGHYSIAMYAALAEAGYLDAAELPTYGLNRLPTPDEHIRPHARRRGGRRLARTRAWAGRRHGYGS